jgi:glycosyltransferase involved in cell wall biosynthesis
MSISGKRNSISVIIPNYNGGRFLAQAIQSVLNQSLLPDEIIVIDDGSTDDSLQILSHFGESIRIIHIPNSGAAIARNLGILESSGELIALLDSDDYWHEDKLLSQLRLITSKPFDLVYCSSQEFVMGSGLGLVHQAHFQGDCYQYFISFPTSAIIKYGCSSTLFRRDLIARSGIFDNSVNAPSEDWDFFRKLSRYAHVGITNEILTYYRIHDSNISRKSLLNYYLGNKIGIKKMILDDSDISFWGSRRIWRKFYFGYLKSFLKERELFLSIYCAIMLTLNL